MVTIENKRFVFFWENFYSVYHLLEFYALGKVQRNKCGGYMIVFLEDALRQVVDTI